MRVGVEGAVLKPDAVIEEGKLAGVVSVRAAPRGVSLVLAEPDLYTLYTLCTLSVHSPGPSPSRPQSPAGWDTRRTAAEIVQIYFNKARMLRVAKDCFI